MPSKMVNGNTKNIKLKPPNNKPVKQVLILDLTLSTLSTVVLLFFEINSLGAQTKIITTRNIMELDRMEVMHNQDKIQSSFSSINGLLKNTESLKEVLGYIKQAGLNKDKEFLHSHQKSEADEILTNLGVIDVVTKEEEGNLDSFYLKTVRLINEIFSTKGI